MIGFADPTLVALDDLRAEAERGGAWAHRATGTGRNWTLPREPSPPLVAEHPRDYARLVAVLAEVASRRPRPTGTLPGVHGVLVYGAAPTPPPSMEPA